VRILNCPAAVSRPLWQQTKNHWRTFWEGSLLNWVAKSEDLPVVPDGLPSDLLVLRVTTTGETA